MLFYHTQHVIQKQGQQEEPHQIIEINDDEEDDSGEAAMERHWNVEDNEQSGVLCSVGNNVINI
jgi:hypothetical protein